MLVSIFGNPDLSFDALPVLLVDDLRSKFPSHTIRVDDPTELDLPETDEWIIIDTVKGIDSVCLLAPEEIAKAKAHSTVHDCDVGEFLLLAKKIRPDLSVRIIGVPMHYPRERALEEICAQISQVSNAKADDL